MVQAKRRTRSWPNSYSRRRRERFTGSVHLAATLNLGRSKDCRCPVDGGSTTSVLYHPLAEIPTHCCHPVAVHGPRRAVGGHRMVEGLPVPTVPPGHGIEIHTLAGTDGLTNGQETVGEDVIKICCRSHSASLCEMPAHYEENAPGCDSVHSGCGAQWACAWLARSRWSALRMAPAVSGRRVMLGDNASRRNDANPNGHVGR